MRALIHHQGHKGHKGQKGHKREDTRKYFFVSVVSIVVIQRW